MSAHVVDPTGNLVADATLDCTRYGSIAIAQAESRTASLFPRPSKAFADGADGPGVPATLSLLALRQGGHPRAGSSIVKEGKLIGAIVTRDGATAAVGGRAN